MAACLAITLALSVVLLPSEALARLVLRGQLPMSSAVPTTHQPNVVAKLFGSTTAEIGDGKGKGPHTGDTYWPGIQGFDGALKYWGGNIMTAPINVHFLFYGDWSKNGGKDMDVITGFIRSLSDASVEAPSVKHWWDLTTKYTNADGATVSAQVSVGKVLVSSGKYKVNLNDIQNGKGDDIFQLVADRINAEAFPKDPSAIYVVMTSPDINVGDSSKGFGGGMCENYCGYHYFNTLADSTKIAYAFVGNSDKCPQGCSAYRITKGGTPNGYSGVDNSVSILGHELSEAATDPYLTGWYTDGQGWEDGDVCAWTFVDDAGSPELLKAGDAYYNMNGVDGFKFLVQTIPDPAKQVCLVQAS